MASIGQIFLCLGAVFILIGVLVATQGRGDDGRAAGIAAANDASRWNVPPAQPKPKPRPAAAAPSAQRASPRDSDSMNDRFFNARLGQNITFNHPRLGAMTGKIIASIHYTELWQRVNSPSEPWVPTGNTFAAHWFGNFMLYEWQARLYVLDEYEAISDQDIQATFMPHARRFAQSDQTAQVTFAWPPASWTIADIGKFRVARAEGSGLHLQPGAEGRFIHAKGADQRALVVEDYQSGGGGQDTAWIGWELTWPDLTAIG